MKPLNFVNSFDPYEANLEESKRRRKRCILICILSAFLIVVFICGLAVGLSAKSKNARKAVQNESIGSTALNAICNKTAFPQSCVSSLSAYPEAARTNPKQLVVLAMRAALEEVKSTLALIQNTTSDLDSLPGPTNLTFTDALDDCFIHMLDSVDHLQDSISDFTSGSRTFLLDDVHTWLSSALTFYTTCMDTLQTAATSSQFLIIETKGGYVQEVITNALSFLVSYRTVLGGGKRRLLTDEILEAGLRRVLQFTDSASNAVVAKDGSGQFVSIQEAVDAAPLKSSTMHMIYIKQGVYEETVVVPKACTNIAFIGDGIDKTVIVGKRSVSGGSTTFASATVAINGKGFVASHLTISNTAGPSGHQAVALRVSADQAAFYRCSFNGYQDTLYAHANRQFYRECMVSGTVDFIFGNAAAVFQRCNILALLPAKNQKIMVTAQGRVTNLQNTGFSFQGCRVDGTGELVLRIPQFPAYLGRPWKDYSRTVFLQSHIGRIIYPAGWSEWDGAPPSRYNTVFYGEYMNVGPGAPQGNDRVNWSLALSSAQAKEFIVANLITGLEWIPKTGLVFTDDL